MNDKEFTLYLEKMRTLSDNDLNILLTKAQAFKEERDKFAHEKLRQELMGNLQKAIGDILHNGFNLVIENVDNPNWAVQFFPDEIYHIEIK